MPCLRYASTSTVFRMWNYKPFWIFFQLFPTSVSLHPSLVNVHIQHPPEADVQIHQVARVQPGQRPAATEGAHSVQQRSQPSNGHEQKNEHSTGHPHTNGNGNGHTGSHNRLNGHVGRCFQETVDGQVLYEVIKMHYINCHHCMIHLVHSNPPQALKPVVKMLFYHKDHYVLIPLTFFVSKRKWACGYDLCCVLDFWALTTLVISCFISSSVKACENVFRWQR